jgi:hypothetical protein
MELNAGTVENLILKALTSVCQPRDEFFLKKVKTTLRDQYFAQLENLSDWIMNIFLDDDDDDESSEVNRLIELF